MPNKAAIAVPEGTDEARDADAVETRTAPASPAAARAVGMVDPPMFVSSRTHHDLPGKIDLFMAIESMGSDDCILHLSFIKFNIVFGTLEY